MTTSRPRLVERTFLFTDLERSTWLWDERPDVMFHALGNHFDEIERAVRSGDGDVINHTGDGLVAVFDDAASAIDAAAEAQRRAMRLPPTELGRLRSRMGVHTGECFEYRGRFSGRALNRCARINAVGHATQILVSGPAAAAAERRLPDELALEPLGEFWLRDLREAEQIFQLKGPGLPDDFPALLTRRTSRDRLPPALTPLIGRDDEVRSMLEMIASRRNRLFVLTGEGGVGKTRLALRIADQAWWTFRDGVHWLDVAATAGGSLAAGLASRIGVPLGQAGLGHADEVARSLTTSELLLVLDNCEYDIDAVVELSTALMSECRDVVIVATSREPLGVAGESRRIVRPLPVGEPDDRRRSPALDLFLSRAVETRAEVRLDVEFQEKADTVVRALGGIPLAIEQAAASLDVRSIDDLVDATTRQRLEAVPGFERISASIEHSLEHLADTDIDLLHELSIFRSAFTAHDVAAVCCDGARSLEEIEARLTRLARASLIQPTSLDSSARFEMSGPLRAWSGAHRTLAPTLVDRHDDHHVALALHWGAEYRRGEQGEAVGALVGSWDDIRVAVERRLAHRDWSRVADVVSAVHEFCLLSLRSDVYLWADEVEPHLSEAEARARIGGICAIGAWQRGEMSRALRLADEAIAMDASPRATVMAFRAAMNAHSYLGSLDDAARYYFPLVDALRSHDDPFWRVDGLASESIGCSQVGLIEPAIEHARAAIELAEQTKNQDCLAWSHHALGLALASRDARSARAAFQRSIDEADSIGSRWNANNARLELLLLQRRLSDQRSDFTFDIEGAQIAWELLGRFDRARSTAQMWQLVLEVAWMLAECGHRKLAIELYRAVRLKPRMPRPDGEWFDHHIESSLRIDRTGESDLADTETFESDSHIIGRCRDGLGLLLGSLGPI